MKIVHICLAASYIEGWGYQENILARMHVQMGYEVTVLTSDYAFNSLYEEEKKETWDYVNADGVHVRVLERVNEKKIRGKLRDFYGLYDMLICENPDIIFVHGGQFLALKDVVKFCKKNLKTKLYIDQHADYYNSPVRTIKEVFANKIVWGHWMRRAIKYCDKFWGVTPWRCEYLQEVYGIPKEKIDLLVMGGDDREIHLSESVEIKKRIRQKLVLSEDDFVIISGGKIDINKNIHLLIKAVSELNIDKVKLIVFGQPDKMMKKEIKELIADIHVRYIGWLEATQVYDFFLASDLAVFPGTHSVLWEQACACGLPAIFKFWRGMQHVDVGGNCIFLKESNKEELERAIRRLYENKQEYNMMKDIALNICTKTFSYKEIAKRAIEYENKEK